jgi:hypothetical protein
MTSSKSVSWSALVNIGNNESLALTVSGEAANPDEARDIFAFASGSSSAWRTRPTRSRRP